MASAFNEKLGVQLMSPGIDLKRGILVPNGDYLLKIDGQVRAD